MAEFPSMPLWTDAYLADTSHLTTIEHGAYLLLLMVMWRSKDKRLPDDDRLLARYTRMTPSQWKRISPTIREFFKSENGQLSQGRLTDEANAVKRYKERQSQAGRASALKRKERHSTTVEPQANQGPTPTPTPTPNSISPNGDNARAKRSRCPDDFWPEPAHGSKTALRMAGWSSDYLAEQVEKFIAHHQDKGTLSPDWQKRWTTWALNNFDDRNGGRKSGGSMRGAMERAYDAI